MQPWGKPVLMLQESETGFPSLIYGLLSNRKSGGVRLTYMGEHVCIDGIVKLNSTNMMQVRFLLSLGARG